MTKQDLSLILWPENSVFKGEPLPLGSFPTVAASWSSLSKEFHGEDPPPHQDPGQKYEFLIWLGITEIFI